MTLTNADLRLISDVLRQCVGNHDDALPETDPAVVLMDRVNAATVEVANAAS